jgi:16S rRNA (guanine527-N7)-methyltransferase
METIKRYFPELTENQLQQLSLLLPLYKDWNEKINVISRKDIDNLYIHHVLHSLAIAKVVHFKKGTTILDIGTGGGFPGIPLAIMFPECSFHLIDSIGKKITVVNEVSKSIGLKNVTTEVTRAELIKKKFHFIVSRAVTNLPEFMSWCKNKISKDSFNDLDNGVLYLKGGDFATEFNSIKAFKIRVFDIKDFYIEFFFNEKRIVFLATL